jgi:nicastrin
MKIVSVKYCDPMGDQNVFLSLGDFEKRKPRSVIVIAARLDTASLFDGLAPGAMSSVTGVVTLLTLANILHNVTSDIQISTGKFLQSLLV